MNTLSLLVPILIPVFITAGIGYAWAKGWGDFDRRFITRLVATVGTPCLAFDSIAQDHVPLNDLLLVMGLAGLGAVLAGLFSWPILKATLPSGPGLPKPRQCVPATMFGNSGNLGIPLCLFAYGSEGVALAVGFSTVITLGHFTLGAALVAEKPDAKAVLRAPVLWAIIAALTFRFTETQVPEVVGNTTGLLAGLTIPLMLMMLGVSLANLEIGRLPLSALMAVLRLGAGFASGLLIVWIGDFDGVMAGVVVLQSAMPVAVYNFLMASQYDGPAKEVAGAIVVSSLAMFATLPFLLAWLLQAAWWL